MNLVEMIGKYVPADTLSKIGGAAGLGPDESQKVSSGAVPLVAAGLASVGSTEQGAGRLLDLARQSGAENMMDRAGDLVGNESSRRSLVESGGGMLSSLFGAKGEGILDAFTAQTGASRTGTRSYLSMLMPLALGVLGRHARTQGLGAQGLASMLAGQAGPLADMLPGGMGRLLGGLMPGRDEREPRRMDVERPREIPAQIRTSEPGRARAPEQPKRRFGVSTAALLAIAVAFLAWALLRQRGPVQTERQATRPTATRPAEPEPGVQRTAPTQGMDALASYSGGDIRGQRFTVGVIQLESGGGQLTQESAQQVDRLAGVMKAHQSMKVRLDGEHADSVRDGLAARGVATERVSTGGQAQGPGVDVVVVEQ